MHRVTNSILALAALALGTAHAMTGGSVEEAFRGEWVPAKAACNSPLKVVIDGNVVTFVNGAQRAEYRKLEQCFTCMGHDVKNMTLLSTDAMGDSPFTITLDGTRKAKPGASVALDKQLGARFPFQKDAALKKCLPDGQAQAPVPYRFEAANYWGSHYQTIANATDPQDCARRCDADGRCLVASFSGPRAPKPWANTCVLRAAVGPRHTEQPDVRSWVKGATAAAPVPPLPGAPYRFERANYWSHNYMTIKNARDPQACARRCDADPKCRVASFSGPGAPPNWANTCVLRHAIGSRHTDQPDIVSWVKP